MAYRHLNLAILLGAAALLASAAPAGPGGRTAEIRRAIERQYEVLERAVETRDFDLFESLRTDDFSTINLEGQPQDRAAMRERTRLLLERLRPPIDAEFEIESIRVEGERAVVAVIQSFNRRQLIDGREHEVRTRVTQDETWVRTGQGWKLKFVEKERNLLRYIDGRRYRPDTPWDPDSPPYDPEGATASPAEREVRAMERQWLDAYEKGDSAAMAAIVADDFTITFPNGTVNTKAHILKQLPAIAARPGGYRFHTREVGSRANGDIVILTGIVVTDAAADGKTVRTEASYTDTWQRRGGRWQVIASHLSNEKTVPQGR